MYIATVTRNFKDVRTTTPKVLLLNIKDDQGQLFRDHCWVVINDVLEKYIPSRDHIKKIIEFQAKIKEYQTIGPLKRTLTSFSNVQLLGIVNKHLK